MNTSHYFSPFFFLLTSWITGASVNAAILDLKNYSSKDFLLSTASTGCMPKGIRIDPVGNFLYVAEMCGKIDSLTKKRVPTVSIYDLELRTLSKTLVTPIGVFKNGIFANTEVEFSLDEEWGLISRSEGDDKSEIFKNFGLLTVVNTDTQKIAKYIPLNGSGSKIIVPRPYVHDDLKHEQIVYVANYFSDNISIIDITHLREDGNLDGSAHFKGLIQLHTNFKNPKSKAYFIAPRGMAFSPDGKYAFVLATETGSLIIIDAVKHQQIAELAPISFLTAKRDLNLRHIIITNDGETAYISHMRGNAISRMSLSRLIQVINDLPKTGKNIILPASVWDELLIPFKTTLGPSKILILEDYPKDHPNFPGGKWSLAHPNTIVLEPIRNRYIYVSHRTSTNSDDSKVDAKIMGKIDIIDTEKDQLVFSLVGGAQPTGLEVSRDGKMLISGGLINDKLYFYDLKKIIDLYEK
jgi:DNA-binding beta-propeller fold protein YncE